MERSRIVQGSPATVAVTFTDQDGEPRAPVGAVTVTIVRGNGTAIVSDASAASTATGATYALTAAQMATLDSLSLTWTEAGGGSYVTTVDVVGGVYFRLADVRAVPGRSDSGVWPDALIKEARHHVERECERITGRAFVPRYNRVTLNGDGSPVVRLPHPDIRAVRSITVGDAALAAAVVADTTAELWGAVILPIGRQFTAGTGNVVIEYEYGLDAPPQDLRDAAVLRALTVLDLRKTGVPTAREYEFIDGRAFALSTPGVRGSATGVREVDVVYDRYRWRRGDLVGVR